MKNNLVKLGSSLLIIALGACSQEAPAPTTSEPIPTIAPTTLGFRSKPLLTIGGLQFRDLNANSTLDAYEDWRLPTAERAANLLSQMTLAEKAGTLMHGTAPGNATGGVNGGGSGYDLLRAAELIQQRHVTSMITRLATEPAAMAVASNALQDIAEASRLGIPLTLSTDPRNHFQFTAGAAVSPSGFSQWPEMLGMAAIGDDALVRRFGDVARQEYRAVGIHMGLSPQADLATEPRWPRVTATFGEDAALARRMAQAYVEGFQHGNNGLVNDSVVMVIKHFAGYGAAKEGLDSHNYYGRFAHFPGNNFEYHIEPFRGAFASQVAGVMPTYSIFENLQIDGVAIEQVGGGYNQWLLTDILRQREGFKGIVLSDWAITQDCSEICINGVFGGQAPTFAGISTGWGVQELTKPQRFAKGLNAGLDQFGGTEEGQQVVEAVQQALVTEARVDQSVLRILQQKFRLGFFENPYVDPAAATALVGNADFLREGEAAQRRSLVLLENNEAVLPLTANGQKVFLHGVAAAAAQAAGFNVVESLDDAELAIIRAETPHQLLHPGYPFGAAQHEGDLDFKDDDATLKVIRDVAAKVPTIVTVMLDRPAILTQVKPLASALFGDFGISDAALLDVITGKAAPEGSLPFELPSSMDAVRNQKPDLPYDSADPLYDFGFGLRY
jgi:beta-glucosidase